MDSARVGRVAAPNALSAFRLVVGLGYLAAGPVPAAPAMVWLVLTAALSDAADGWLARRLKVTTSFGSLLDKVADRVLIGGVLVRLAAQGVVPVALAALILAQYLIVAIEGLLYLRRARSLPAPDIVARTSFVLASVMAIAGLLTWGRLVSLTAAAGTVVANSTHIVTAWGRVKRASGPA